MLDSQQQQLTNQQFAAKIRAKYPGSYDSISDDDLTNRIVAKYPSYKSVLAATPEAGATKDLGSLLSKVTAIRARPPDTRSFLQRLLYPGDLNQLEDATATVRDYMTRGKPAGVADFQGGIVTGPLEMAHGAATALQNPVRAGHELISGAGKTIAFPSAIAAGPAAASNPSGLIKALIGGYAGGKVGSKGAELLGADPETQQLSGDIGSLIGGYGGAKSPSIVRGAGRVLTRASNVVSPDVVGIASPRLANAMRVAQKLGKVGDTLSKQPSTISTIAGTAQEAVKPVTGPGKAAIWSTDEPAGPVSRPVNEVKPAPDIPAVQTHELPVPSAQPVTPASMEGFYGKTKPRSLLPAHKRQLASPTASTAPGQAAAPAPEPSHPPSIMAILLKQGEPTDAEMAAIRQHFGTGSQQPAQSGLAGFKNYTTIGQITGQGGKAASAKASQGAAAPLSPLLQDALNAVKEADARVAAEPNTYVRSVEHRPGYGTAKVPVEERIAPPKVKVRRRQAGR